MEYKILFTARVLEPTSGSSGRRKQPKNLEHTFNVVREDGLLLRANLAWKQLQSVYEVVNHVYNPPRLVNCTTGKQVIWDPYTFL